MSNHFVACISFLFKGLFIVLLLKLLVCIFVSFNLWVHNTILHNIFIVYILPPFHNYCNVGYFWMFHNSCNIILFILLLLIKLHLYPYLLSYAFYPLKYNVRANWKMSPQFTHSKNSMNSDFSFQRSNNFRTEELYHFGKFLTRN